jgi:hypothetical protein
VKFIWLEKIKTKNRKWVLHSVKSRDWLLVHRKEGLRKE